MRSRAISVLALIFICTPFLAQACPDPRTEVGRFAQADLHFEILTQEGRRFRPEGLAPFPATHDGPVRAAIARAELERFMAGKTILTPKSTPPPDRWGRVTTRMRTAGGEDVALWLAASGLVRMAPVDLSCSGPLLEAEEKARKAKLGLWGDPYYSVLATDDPAALRSRAGDFVILEGRVRRLGQTSARFYLDFGPVRGVDLSVSFNKQTAKAIVAANMAPESLVGRNIRIRGILELRPGPQIEVAGPAALQIMGC